MTGDITISCPFSIIIIIRLCSETTLISTNMVIMLGHVAVSLKNIPKTTDTILTFFIQYFDRKPSHMHAYWSTIKVSLDILIIDQLGCMVIAQCDPASYDEIMGLFTSITKSSNMPYTQGNGQQDDRNKYKYNHV